MPDGKKITPAQSSALRALPVSITVYGGRIFGGAPKGIRTRRTLEALNAQGLATYTEHCRDERWRLTPAGTALLRSLQSEEPSNG